MDKFLEKEKDSEVAGLTPETLPWWTGIYTKEAQCKQSWSWTSVWATDGDRATENTNLWSPQVWLFFFSFLILTFFSLQIMKNAKTMDVLCLCFSLEIRVGGKQTLDTRVHPDRVTSSYDLLELESPQQILYRVLSKRSFPCDSLGILFGSTVQCVSGTEILVY